MTIVLGISNILTAFDDHGTVGTKVISGTGDIQYLLKQEMKKVEGFQGGRLITLPTDAYHLVRNGVAPREGLNDEDKFYRRYREVDHIFAKPEFAVEKVESLGVYVMTRDSYFKDPEVGDAEQAALIEGEATHVMVAIHAPADQPLDYVRLAHNISGLNSELILESYINEDGDMIHTHSNLIHDTHVALKMVEHAQATLEYEKKWIVVAEPRPPTRAEREAQLIRRYERRN